MLVLLGLGGVDHTDVFHQFGHAQEGRFLDVW